MYFLDIDGELLSPYFAPGAPSAEERIESVLPLITEDRTGYLNFGPYWWRIKPLLKTMGKSRGTWLRGPYSDRDFSGIDIDPRLAFAYREIFAAESIPARLHIVELEQQEPRWYRLVDPDTQEQLDLFETMEPEKERIQDAAEFSVTPWLRKADELASDGHYHHAAGALLRGLERARVQEERSRILLQLGQTFQLAGHFRKALLCYRDAVERGKESWIAGLMGDVYMEIHRPADAIRCYEQALKAMPGNPEYRFGYERARSLADRMTG